MLHNIFYAAFAFIAGWLADRFRKNLVLATGYALAAVMAILIIALPASVWMLGTVFVLGGIYVGIEETLEDSLCAELVDEAHHGMAFGVLATVNGIGDFLSSAIVGLLWSVAGTTVAFGYSAALFTAGAVLVARLRAGGDISRIAEIQFNWPRAVSTARPRLPCPKPVRLRSRARQGGRSIYSSDGHDGIYRFGSVFRPWPSWADDHRPLAAVCAVCFGGIRALGFCCASETRSTMPETTTILPV